MKIKITAIISFAIINVICCFLSVSAAADITVSNPHFYTAGITEVETFILEAGVIKGQLTVDNKSSSPSSAALLLVLYDKESGLMKDLTIKQFDNLPVGETNISDTISISSANGNVLRAFVWNNADGESFSMSRQYELYDSDIAPTAPSNIHKTTATYRTVELAWDEPYDNLGVVSYQVYKNGNLIGSPLTNDFKDTGLLYGTAYTYEIKAVDASGNISDFSAAEEISTNDAAWAIFGATNVTNLLDKTILISENFEDGYYSEVMTMGPADDRRECRKIEFIKPYNGDPNGKANYLMIGVDGSYIRPTDRIVTIKIIHLDSGTDTIGISYNSTTSAYKVVTLPKTNTGKWVTTTFNLTDAEFDNKQIGGQYDFRIETGESNTSEYIYKVEVFKGIDE